MIETVYWQEFILAWKKHRNHIIFVLPLAHVPDRNWLSPAKNSHLDSSLRLTDMLALSLAADDFLLPGSATLPSDLWLEVIKKKYDLKRQKTKSFQVNERKKKFELEGKIRWRLRNRQRRGRHLGLGPAPAWTSCHTCCADCLASTSEGSKGVAIWSILPSFNVLPWRFSCLAKYAVQTLLRDNSSYPPLVCLPLSWLISWFF